jgi:hypothetical protein
MTPHALQLQPAGDPFDPKRAPPPPAGLPEDADQLPYHVEVWDASEQFIEQVVAVSVSASIGYAAFYAAAKEFPDRPIILRHRDRIISRWTTQKQ